MLTQPKASELDQSLNPRIDQLANAQDQNASQFNEMIADLEGTVVFDRAFNQEAIHHANNWDVITAAQDAKIAILEGLKGSINAKVHELVPTNDTKITGLQVAQD